jgi:hypothetical protein
MLRAGLFNFSKGEIAEELLSRIDVPSYNAAAKQARNVIILKYGGLQKRPGTQLVAPAYDSAEPVRLLPFQFSITQAYALEFGQAYMRAAANGGLVLETPLTISAITRAFRAQVTIAFHGYSVGDQIYFNDVAGMKEINGQVGTVLTVPDANNVTTNIDTTRYSAFTGDSGGIVNTAPPPPPPTPPVVPAPAPAPTPPPVSGGGFIIGVGGGLSGGGRLTQQSSI